MIQDRIDKIEAKLRDAQNLPGETRQELLTLLSDLKTEVASLTTTHVEDADSITRFADASVHEAMRSTRKPEQAATALKGLTASVDDFKASHPKLVEIVDRLAVTLSNMGI